MTDTHQYALAHCRKYQTDYANLTSLLDDGVEVPLSSAIPLSTVDSEKRKQHEEALRRANQSEGVAGGGARGGMAGRDRDAKVPPLQEIGQEELLKKLIPGTLKRLFITGDGGSGKTEFTRLIALNIANAYIAASEQGVSLPLLPYRIELKTIGSAEITGSKALTDRLIPDDQDWLLPLAKSGQVIFILDGLDELPVKADDFFKHLSRFISDYSNSSFIFAGRPGSLPLSIPDLQTHEIRPLNYKLIEQYARKYFASRKYTTAADAEKMASGFISQLRANQSTLDPLIFTPFMVGFALHQHAKGKPIPANPAELIESGLTELFTVRRSVKNLPLPGTEICLEALSTIAAFTQMAHPHDTSRGPGLECTVSDAERWLVEQKAHLKPIEDSTDPGQAASALRKQLVPHAGVLFMSGTTLSFSNRVLAEFLAARFIARHGYPNWPYREGETYVGRLEVKDPLERSLFDFFGDFAWSNAYESLAHSVRFEVGRRDPDFLLKVAEWIYATAKPFDCAYHCNSFDVRRTCISRIFHFFQALPAKLSAEHQNYVLSIAIKIVPIDSEWFLYEFWQDLPAKLPYACRHKYLPPLISKLKAYSNSSNGNDDAISSLVKAIVSGFSGDAQLMSLTRDTLASALTSASKAPYENADTIRCLAEAISHGFAGDTKARETLANALSDVSNNLTQNWILIRDLSQAISIGFAGDKNLMNQARDAIGKILIAACNGLIEWSFSLSYLPQMLSRYFAGDAKARDILEQALNDVLEFPAKHSEAIQVIRAISSGFAYDNSLMSKSRDYLIYSVKYFYDNPEENEIYIEELGYTILYGFSGDRGILDSLVKALTIISNRPMGSPAAICALSQTLSSAFPQENTIVSLARDTLAKALTAAGKNQEKDWAAIYDLAEIGARCFAGDVFLRVAIGSALDAASAAPYQNWQAIGRLAGTISSGFVGDANFMSQARDALSNALNAASRTPKKNMDAILSLAETIFVGFASDMALLLRARDVLVNAMTAASKDFYKNMLTIVSLARVLSSGFAGDIQAALTLTRVGCSRSLNSEEWSNWIVLHGPEAELRRFFLESWDIPESEIFGRVTPWNNPDATISATPAPGLIVCPRERIRRGLPAWVLHEIVADYFHNSDDLGLLSYLLRQIDTAPANHAANWLDALRYLEETDSLSKLDAATAKKETTLEKLRKKLANLAAKPEDLEQASIQFSYPNKAEVPNMSTIKQANADLSDPYDLTKKRYGPQTIERIRQLRERIGMRKS